MNRPVDCDAPAIPVVRLAEGRVQRLVVHMEDPRSSGRAKLNRPRESPDEQPLDEVVNLLPVRDAGEDRVLPADENPGMPHHCDEETGLTIGEAKRRQRSTALSGSPIRALRM